MIYFMCVHFLHEFNRWKQASGLICNAVKQDLKKSQFLGAAYIQFLRGIVHRIPNDKMLSSHFWYINNKNLQKIFRKNLEIKKRFWSIIKYPNLSSVQNSEKGNFRNFFVWSPVCFWKFPFSEFRTNLGLPYPLPSSKLFERQTKKARR